MKEKRQRRKRQPNLFLKCLVSVVALGAIVYFGSMAIKFCLSLFAGGDYVVTFPGETSPVVQKPAYTATEPVDETTG